MKAHLLSLLAIASPLLFAPGVAFAAPPANDNFANARTLSKSFETVSGTTIEATRQAGERSDTGYNTVWYKWTAPGSGRLRIAVQPTGNIQYFGFDLWRGSALANLRRVGGSEGMSGERAIEDVPIRKGVVYYVSVGQSHPAGHFAHKPGSFDVSFVLISEKDIPSEGAFGGTATNDQFSAATDMTGHENTRVGISYGLEALEREAGEPTRNPKYSSWWKWTAAKDGALGISLAGSQLGEYFVGVSRKTVAVYETTSFQSMATSSPLAYSTAGSGLPPDVGVPVKKGKTYYITAGVGGIRPGSSNYEGGSNPGHFAWRVLTLSFQESAPSLSILGNGVPIPNGSTVPAVGNRTDFGNVRVSSGSIVRTFILANDGTSELAFTGSATIDGSGAFTVVEQPASSVPPGGSTTLVLAFSPRAQGHYTATVGVSSNDPKAGLYTFAIQGAAIVSPALSVVTQPSAFPALRIGKAASRRVTIANRGGSTLGGLSARVSGRAARDFRVGGPARRTLAPGAATTAKVTFRPRAKGVRKATLTVRGNAPAAKVPLSGRGKAR